MQNNPHDETTWQDILTLIQANFAGRDDLRSAADALDSDTLSTICRRLGDDLADNAIELQQMALAAGMKNVNIHEFGAQLQAELMHMIQRREGDAALLEEAEQCEQIIEQEYDKAIEKADSPGVKEVLRKQRDKVEFGKNVVHDLRPPDEQQSR